jgi:cell division protein FtsW (lipid II flippase)
MQYGNFHKNSTVPLLRFVYQASSSSTEQSIHTSDTRISRFPFFKENLFWKVIFFIIVWMVFYYDSKPCIVRPICSRTLNLCVIFIEITKEIFPRTFL